MDSFPSVLEYSQTYIEIEKSKFIAYVSPVDTESEAVDFIQSIKKKHYDATHNVSAYHIRDNYFCKRYSDDGEPAGTAGLPILQTIINMKLVDVCVVVTRYFGGIKLGAGGLARAYADIASKGLLNSKIINFQKMDEYKIEIDYTFFNSLQYHLKKSNILIKGIDFEEKVNIDIFILPDNRDLIDSIQNLSFSTATINRIDSHYIACEDNRILAQKVYGVEK